MEADEIRGPSLCPEVDVTWRPVPRTDSLEELGRWLTALRPGPLVVTGEPGAGRTTLLAQALDLVDPARDRVVVVGAALPTVGTDRHDVVVDSDQHHVVEAVVPAAVEAITAAVSRAAGHDGGRRVVVVVDDAHLAGHAAVQCLRDLHRAHQVALLTTRPAHTATKPDPLDCLRYEAGIRFLTVRPLDVAQTWTVLCDAVGGPVARSTAAALQAATGGNPRRLADLMTANHLATRLVERHGRWELPTVLDGPVEVGEAGRRRIVEAVHEAWLGLSLAPLRELCTLAVAAGAVHDVAGVLPFTLMLFGRTDEGLRFLDRLDPATAADGRVLLTRALLVALGARRVYEAMDLLDSPAAHAAVPAPRLAAVRAWLLATTGRDTGTIEVTGDLEASVFARAAQACVELRTGRARLAVPHLRRAIIGAQSLRRDLPWLPPLLTGALIDALLLAGRVNEATAAAADFHAVHEGSGWDVAVSLSALIRSATPAEPAELPTPAAA
jgi:hypothetical protein